MIQECRCENCNKPKADVHFSFTYEDSHCGDCYHTEHYKWLFWFCNLTCFFAWLKKHEIEEKGLPCQGCRRWDGSEQERVPTGWASGFESNGICKVCDGTKRVKAKVFFNRKYERIDDPYPDRTIKS